MPNLLPARPRRSVELLRGVRPILLLGVALSVLCRWPVKAAAPHEALPAAAPAAAALCINEFLPRVCAAPPSDARLAAAQTFIELYNRGAETVEVGGWTLKVGSASYTIPAGTSLAGGAYLVSAKGLSFSAQGTVALLDAGGASVDQKGYNSPRCNLSLGRYPNGGSTWYDSLAPSPGGPNVLATATALPAPTRTPTRIPTATVAPSVAPTATNATPKATQTPTPASPPTTPTGATGSMTPPGTATATPSPGTATPSADAQPCLSEFMPAPRYVDWDGDGTANYADEWIELYNPSTEELDLSGWQIDDRAGGGSRPYTFPARSHLGAGAYGAYYQRQTGLALNNDGDDVRLVDPDGREVDRATYVVTAPDASYSRVGGCGGHWVMDLAPSPGQPNPRPPALYLPLICGL